jgi:hypothetical protein
VTAFCCYVTNENEPHSLPNPFVVLYTSLTNLDILVCLPTLILDYCHFCISVFPLEFIKSLGIGKPTTVLMFSL